MWESWEGLGPGVVFQEDAVALENHVRLAVNNQRALVRLEPHRVAELPAVGRHLEEARSQMVDGAQYETSVTRERHPARNSVVIAQLHVIKSQNNKEKSFGTN